VLLHIIQPLKMSDSDKPISEEIILNGCRQNDRRSQELLYRQFHRQMLSLCFRYTKNQEDAVEVMQNGFLKVFKNIGSYDTSKSSLFTWIHTIMVRTAIDFIRSNTRSIVSIDWDDDTEPSIDPEVLTQKSADEILRFLKRLPTITALVFNLNVIEGYSHKEIAEMLKLSEGTSRWHLCEAKKILSQHIRSKAIA